MINVCNEEDCPLHVDNSWRADTLLTAKEELGKLSDMDISHDNLMKFILLVITKYDGENIPTQCMNCLYRKQRDMKSEVISDFAKHELLQ